ncbi:MAG TPA: autotransporter outer membrane beta-barrel domain-containing protein, partial [Novosphingobium sp.]|nr:autotransporter outer membrane beta-barrel domain-containing protein [Novosphingobium sp.]
AVGGISGNFTSVTYNGNSSSLFLDWDIIGAVSSGSGSEQYYEVSATHTGYANAMRSNGGTNNQIAVASGLDPLISIANADTTSGEATLLGEVDALNLAQAKVFLNSVSPEGYLAYATALRDQANMFARTVDQRMTDQNSKHPEDGWWFTTMAQFDFASTASTQGGYRTRDHMFGLAAGYDLSGPNHVIGLATSISWDSLHYALNSLNGTNRDWAVALYGAQNFGRLRLYGQIAYNMGHLSTTKTITIGDYTWTANARAPEHLFKATANLGYTWSLGQYKLEPFGGIDFNSGRVAGFTEYNAGAADLTVSAMSASHTDVLAGVNVTRNKGIFRPYFKMAYRRQLTGDRNTVSAYFDGQSSGTFSVTGLPVGRDEIDPSAGINWVFDDAGSLYVGYQGTIRSNYNSEGINLGIRLEF